MYRNQIFGGASGALLLATFACTPGGVALAPVEFEGMDDPATVVGMARGVTRGNPDAPITIAEFADYQCPGCAGFAGQVKPLLDQAYGDGDQVKFVFYDYPLVTIHPHAFLASRAARCAADQDRYWDYHDALFRNQQAWSLSQSAPLGLFEDYAAEAGLEASAFRACLRSDMHAELVTANMQLGNLLGVTGTPTVMVSQGDGTARRLGDTSFPGVRGVVDEMLANLAPQSAGGPEAGGQ
ncbi:MAG: thioredoxin domain-containing protein [Longimicrobiales bacterium]|nr:thioredoxin domain-containing protein [Longimicrobiales bacterium]